MIKKYPCFLLIFPFHNSNLSLTQKLSRKSLSFLRILIFTLISNATIFIIIVLYYFYRTISNEFCIVVIDIYQVKYKIFIQDSSFLDKNVIIGWSSTINLKSLRPLIKRLRAQRSINNPLQSRQAWGLGWNNISQKNLKFENVFVWLFVMNQSFSILLEQRKAKITYYHVMLKLMDRTKH